MSVALPASNVLSKGADNIKSETALNQVITVPDSSTRDNERKLLQLQRVATYLGQPVDGVSIGYKLK